MIPAAWLSGGAAVVAASGFVLAGLQTVRLSDEKADHASTKLEFSRADRKAFDQAVQDRDAAQGRADKAARDFETWKTAQRPRLVAINKEVRDAQAIDPVCPGRPLPDSLRDALKRAPEAVGARDAVQPGAVSGMVGR